MITFDGNLTSLRVCLAGCAVRGGGEGADRGSVWEELPPQRDGTAGADPRWHKQACGATAEWALHQCPSTDRPAAAQTAPVSSALFPYVLSVVPFRIHLACFLTACLTHSHDNTPEARLCTWVLVPYMVWKLRFLWLDSCKPFQDKTTSLTWKCKGEKTTSKTSLILSMRTFKTWKTSFMGHDQK